MKIKIPNLEGGKEVKAMVTFEIRRSQLLAPENTDGYTIPDSEEARARVAALLVPEPEDRMPRSENPHPGQGDRRRQTEGVGPRGSDLRLGPQAGRVREGRPLKGTLAALRDKTGECEDMSSLFIAICRAVGIPARTVWVTGHCYPEFCLVDEKGQGHWFPCQAAGARAFGCIPEMRPILQKGDNFRLCQRKKPRAAALSGRVSQRQTLSRRRPADR